jgi:Protein of unknown function (DUF2742)
MTITPRRRGDCGEFESRGSPNFTAAHGNPPADALPLPGLPCVSRSIHWWPFRAWVQRRVPEHLEGSAPMAGSDEWFALDDSDPMKLAAVLIAAEHHVLRCETAQEHMAEAARAISAAADWPQIAQQVRDRAEFRREHPWARRRST